MMVSDTSAPAQWRKSTRSAQGGVDCVEVANLSSATDARDASTTDRA